MKIKDPPKAPPAPWPDHVRTHFAEGWRYLYHNENRRTAIASARGWPAEWVNELVANGEIALPWLPWDVPDRRRAHRGIAFRVRLPVYTGDFQEFDLQTVGYHQRFWINERKAWTYVPSIPSDPKTSFQAQLKIDAKKIPAAPFVVGKTNHPDIVIITEGQWDAWTLFKAANWQFENTTTERHLVFGMRGASSVDVFLNYYGKFIQACAPLVWLLCDADAAGRGWYKAPDAPRGQDQKITFKDRIQAAGAARVITTAIRPESGLKDLNDWYKQDKPGPEQIKKFMEREGIY